MNKERIIDTGLEIEKVSELSELCEKYEAWKAEVLRYAADNNLSVEQYRILLHAVSTPYESIEEKVEKYRVCIKKTILYLRKEEGKKQEADTWRYLSKILDCICKICF